MRNLLHAIVLCFAFSTYAFGDEGSFSHGAVESFSVFYSPITEKVYLGFGGYEQDLKMVIIHPVTLEQEKVIPLSGGLTKVIPVYNGGYLLVLVDSTGPSDEWINGAILKIKPDSGEVLNEFVFEKSANDFCIDSNEEYVYIAGGEMNRPGEITKFSVNSFQIIESIEYGDEPNQIEITPDGSKIYVNNKDVFRVDNEFGYFYELGIFDTSDLSKIKSIKHRYYQPLFTMGSNGYLYVSCGSPWEEGAPNFVIFDTNNDDELIYSKSFGSIWTGFISLDPAEENVYLTTERETYYEPDIFEDYIHEPSNIIIEIASDFTTREIVFQGGNLSVVAVAEINGVNRLFCTDFDSPLFYWKDVDAELPPNQDPICVLVCPTTVVSDTLPVAVAFDASGSYDPDGDPITYHWDFNGDGIFDGLDDEYTGDPWNPTHEFTSYGEYEVSLKVMDNRDGECVETVVIEIGEG